MFVEALVLRPEKSLLSHGVFNLFCLIYQPSYLEAVLCLDPLFTCWAIQEVEDNARCRPPLFQNLLDAIQMEDVFTAELNAGLRTQSTHPTNRAVGILISVWQDQVLYLITTLRVQTGQTLGLASESTTLVATRKCLRAPHTF